MPDDALLLLNVPFLLSYETLQVLLLPQESLLGHLGTEQRLGQTGSGVKTTKTKLIRT